MPNYAKVTLVGHVGRIEEERTAGDGTVRAFTVAVNSGRDDNAVTTWYKVSAWRGLGKLVQYINVGDPVMVAGSLVLREYTKKDGGAGYELAVTANDIVLLTRRDDENRDKGENTRRARLLDIPEVMHSDEYRPLGGIPQKDDIPF